MIGTATRSATIPGHVRMVTGYAATSELVSLLRQCVKQAARATLTWDGHSVTGSAEGIHSLEMDERAVLRVCCPALPGPRLETDECPQVRVRIQAQEVSFVATAWRSLDAGMLEVDLPDHFQESHFRLHTRHGIRGEGIRLHLAGSESAMTVKDVSQGGLGVALGTRDAQAFDVDGLYGPFRMELPTGGSIAFHAEVRYRLPRVTEGSTRMGLAIRRISPDHEARLRTYLDNLEHSSEGY